MISHTLGVGKYEAFPAGAGKAFTLMLNLETILTVLFMWMFLVFPTLVTN